MSYAVRLDPDPAVPPEVIPFADARGGVLRLMDDATPVDWWGQTLLVHVTFGIGPRNVRASLLTREAWDCAAVVTATAEGASPGVGPSWAMAHARGMTEEQVTVLLELLVDDEDLRRGVVA